MDILLFLPIILLCQEKSSALLLRPKRRSAANQIVKACAAQQGVGRCALVHDHIDKFQLGEKKAAFWDAAFRVLNQLVFVG